MLLQLKQAVANQQRGAMKLSVNNVLNGKIPAETSVIILLFSIGKGERESILNSESWVIR